MADLKDALSAISLALGVIATGANTPGLNLIPYVSTIAGAASALQAAIKVGINIEPYISAIKDTFSGKLPTGDEIAALRAKIAELEAKVDAALPPPDEDEPE